MSELINLRRNGQFRNRLLLTASASALFLSVATTPDAKAEDSDHPIIWIEVGGAFDQMSAGETSWSPPNLTPLTSSPQPLPFGKLPTVGYNADLKLSFTPENSDWVYSASVRYGRAQHGPRSSHHQSGNVRITYTYGHLPYSFLTNFDFVDAAQQSHSTHAIVDFAAGKDVGLGILGGGESVISAGVRIAQLNERAEGRLTAFVSATRYRIAEVADKAELLADRSLTGIGPAISWDASAPLLGSLSNGFSFDWGANAAILFGRQKANVSLRAMDARYYKPHGYPGYTAVPPKVLSQSSQTPVRNKTVIVPNLGGFAGLSWHLPSFKVSLGYRADFFFGAIDGGLATSQKETRGFYGPFANVSIGLGG